MQQFLLRLWVFATGLIALFNYFMIPFAGMNAHSEDFMIWLKTTAFFSALLFVFGAGLVWVFRPAQRGP